MRTSLEAKLWAIYRGLTIVFEKGYKDLIINTNSTEAIELLKVEFVITFPMKSLVADAKFLISKCGYIVQHVLRKGNKSADGLAKMGANQDKALVVMEDPMAKEKHWHRYPFKKHLGMKMKLFRLNLQYLIHFVFHSI